jgi:hypothetical protein
MPAAGSETVRSLADPTEGETGVSAPSTMFDEPGGSSSSGEPVRMVGEQDRKRKGREAEEWEYQSEVSELTQPFSIFYIFILYLELQIPYTLFVAGYGYATCLVINLIVLF